MKLEFGVRELALRAPFRSAHGTSTVRPIVETRLVDDDGLVGCGEAAPLESYDGVTIKTVLAALEACRPALETGAQPPRGLPPQALAAIDLAWWDLAGRRAGQPVWRLLNDGAGSPAPIRVNATIGAEDPAAAGSQAGAAAAAGFTCVKVKVGVGEDNARIAAVREAAGPGIAIRLDANGALPVESAAVWLDRLGPIELCEEPVHGVSALESVAARTTVPIAADETTANDEIFDRRVCAAVCLKISRSGGITGLLADAARALRLGYEVYLASTLDGPLGIAAALHAAAVIGPHRPCGLATLDQFELAPIDALRPQAGTIAIPTGPGLLPIPERNHASALD